MAAQANAVKQILHMARDRGLIRAREVVQKGIHPEYLRRLCAKGELERVSRGVYALPDDEFSAHRSLVEVSKQVPKGVVCLLSALRFHELGTQAPHEVWLAVERRSAKPRIQRPPVRVLRFSGPAFHEGIEEHEIEKVPVRIYSPAKTVADCFKYRNRIGLDVALEALRDCLENRKGTRDELWRYARVCRVANVMKPYLEVMFPIRGKE